LGGLSIGLTEFSPLVFVLVVLKGTRSDILAIASVRFAGTSWHGKGSVEWEWERKGEVEIHNVLSTLLLTMETLRYKGVRKTTLSREAWKVCI